MFREMFLVTGLQKAIHEDPEAVPAMEVLKMATVNGAHAMGLTDCDVLAPGKKADIVMIDLNPVSYTHLDVYKRQVWEWMYTVMTRICR